MKIKLIDKLDITEGEHCEYFETPVFRDVGAMIDMSHNGAMNTHGVKAMLRASALMGMTYATVNIL